MNNKTCTHCKVSYPETVEFFNVDGRHNKSTLRPKCKNCEKAYRDASKEHRAEVSKSYRINSKDKVREDHKNYYRKNIEKISKYYSDWRDKNVERLTEYRKKYWSDNKKHKQEYDKEHSKVYRAEHKEEKNAHTRNRRAKIKQSGGKHTAADIARQYERQKGKCYWCGVSVGSKYHVDHVIPITRGGSNDPSNLVISCPTCNHSKGAKLPHEWGDKMF